MHPCLLEKVTEQLHAFPQITDFGLKKINLVQFGSMKKEVCQCLRIYYVMEGRFDWLIEDQHYCLYPGDVAIILPDQSFGSVRGFLDIGTVWWMHLEFEQIQGNNLVTTGDWSRLNNAECSTISKILSVNTHPILSKFTEVGRLFQYIYTELVNQDIGCTARINQLIDELLILIARKLTRQNTARRGCPQGFVKLEQALREDLSHQWTVEEMAALFGLGLTAFSEKVKSFTGFSPLNYLINIRVSEAIKLLKQQHLSVTDIALEVGFYSSQHFATTFKKLTGYTPSEYRKKNTPVEMKLSA